MAKKIPGGLPEVTEVFTAGEPQAPLRPNDPAFHGDGRYGAPPNPLPGETLKPVAEPPGVGRRVADALRGAGTSVREAGTAVGESLTSAGQATRGMVAPVAKGALRATGALAAPAMEIAPHAGFYTDKTVPFTDKLRVGATDALATLGGAGGALGGAIFGSAVAPVAGTIAGGVVGGVGGAKGARAVGNFVTGADDVLRRNGYNPDRDVIDVGSDLMNGKGRASFGTSAALPTAPPAQQRGDFPKAWNGRSYEIDGGSLGSTAGAGRGFVNPANVDPGASTPQGTKVVIPEGQITRDGNSFSGTNVRAGAGVYNPNGSLRESKGFGVSSLDTSEGYRQNLLELQRNAAERASAPAPGGVAGIGSRGTTMLDDLVAKANAPTRSNTTIGERQTMAANANALRMAELQSNTSLANNESSNATSRANNAESNRTALRGQDIELQGRMAPLQLAAMQRAMHAQAYGAVGAGGKDGSAPISVEQHLAAAKMLHAQGLPELAAKAEAAAASAQTLTKGQDDQAASRADTTTKLFKPYFSRTDADGKTSYDEVGAGRAAATVREMYGDQFDRLPQNKKASVMAEIVAKQRNMDAERQVSPGFIDRAKDLVGMYEKPPEVTSPRNLSGGKLERAGLISPSGVTRNSTLLRLPDGTTINYGELNTDQLKDIEARRQLR